MFLPTVSGGSLWAHIQSMWKRENRENIISSIFFCLSNISISVIMLVDQCVCVCARILVCFYIPRSFLAAHTRKLIIACLSLWREVRTANVCYKRWTNPNLANSKGIWVFKSFLGPLTGQTNDAAVCHSFSSGLMKIKGFSLRVQLGLTN